MIRPVLEFVAPGVSHATQLRDVRTRWLVDER